MVGPGEVDEELEPEVKEECETKYGEVNAVGFRHVHPHKEWVHYYYMTP